MTYREIALTRIFYACFKWKPCLRSFNTKRSHARDDSELFEQ